MDAINTIKKKFRRTRAMLDKSAWMLMAPALAFLFLMDEALAKTLVTWLLFGLVIAGASVIISRIIFPQVDLTDLIHQVSNQRNVAAGIVAGAIIIFVALVMFALVTWAKT